MNTPYDKLAKIYTNCSGHMTKMAFKNLLLQNQKADDLATLYETFNVGPTKFVQMMILVDLYQLNIRVKFASLCL